VAAVVDATVGAGIAPALAAFRDGFAEAAPLAALAPFSPADLDALLCGLPGAGPAADAAWARPALAAAIRFDHGYSASSEPASHFLDALASFTPPQRAAFLRFATGAPRLPPGGLGGLHPRLTVVRKHPAASGGGGGGDLGTSLGTSLGGRGGTPGSLGGGGGGGALAASAPGGGRGFMGGLAAPGGPADGDLPSVMTCANYIKLPPYSSAGVARDRLLFAMAEGQGSFDLS
jgi:E3 ubiquitin-protein ligase TRIP12